MLIRSVAIMVCISLVGMTVVPASWLPCCCKSKSKSLESERPIASCCAEKSSINFTIPNSQGHSCCPVNLKDDRSCACSSAIRGICSACRCAEQMQIVALSGYSAQEETSRDRLVTLYSVSQSSVIVLANNSVPVKDVNPPGMVTLLRTFILVC